MNNCFRVTVISFIMAAFLISCATDLQDQKQDDYELAGLDMICISEIASTGAYEFIELYNNSDTDVMLGDNWVLDDNGFEYCDCARALKLPSDLIIPAKGYLVICPYIESDAKKVLNNTDIPNDAVLLQSFSINNHDHITLYYDCKIVDEYSWETEINSIGKLNHELSKISFMMIPTPGSENIEESLDITDNGIVINEINSKSRDYIELINNSNEPVDFGLHQWSIEDIQKSDRLIIPGDIILLQNEMIVIYPNDSPQIEVKGEIIELNKENSFGLGSNDMVILRKDGTIVDYHAWDMHVSSQGRLPDGAVLFTEMKPTPGRPNEEM